MTLAHQPSIWDLAEEAALTPLAGRVVRRRLIRGAWVDHLPGWVVVACYAAIAVGTLFGGWRIVKTMGQRITKLRPVGGFAAECGGAVSLFMATHFGIPVSTTHTITGAIMGVGAARRASAVRWGVAGNIVIAWFLTIPASALTAWLFYELTLLF